MEDSYITSLVDDWNETYKKSQLTLWVMLALAHGEKYAAEIAEFMYDITHGVFVVQEQSLYRALRRFRRMGLIQVREGDSERGPKRKYYSLSLDGRSVLQRFIGMHIQPMYSQTVKNTINAIMEERDE